MRTPLALLLIVQSAAAASPPKSAAPRAAKARPVAPRTPPTLADTAPGDFVDFTFDLSGTARHPEPERVSIHLQVVEATPRTRTIAIRWAGDGLAPVLAVPWRVVVPATAAVRRPFILGTLKEAHPAPGYAACADGPAEAFRDAPAISQEVCFGKPALGLSGGEVAFSRTESGMGGDGSTRTRKLVGSGRSEVDPELLHAPLAFGEGSSWTIRSEASDPQRRTITPGPIEGTPLEYACEVFERTSQRQGPVLLSAPGTLTLHGQVLKVRRVPRASFSVGADRITRRLEVELDGPVPDGAPLEPFLEPLQVFIDESKVPASELIDWTPAR